MNPRPFALLVGILLVLLGAGGFVPAIVVEQTDPLRIAADVGHPLLAGLLPVSPALNLIHIGLGAWGVASARSLRASVGYARTLALASILLAIFGVIPGLDTLFGAAPLYGNNLLLHGLLAAVAALFGWLYRRPAALPAPARRRFG